MKFFYKYNIIYQLNTMQGEDHPGRDHPVRIAEPIFPAIAGPRLGMLEITQIINAKIDRLFVQLHDSQAPV